MPFQVKVEREEDAKVLSREDAATALNERSEQLHQIFEQAGPDMDPSKVTVIDVKDGVELATQIRNRNTEMGWIGKRQQEFDEADAIKAENDRRRSQPVNPGNWAPNNNQPRPEPVKSFGQQFVASDLYKSAMAKQTAHGDLAVNVAQFMGRSPQNTVFSTSAGWAPETLRTGRVVLDEQREVEVTDALPMFPTTQAAIVYMEETTFTNAAAERAEAAAYAEGAIALTERSVTVRSVGVSLPVTDEQLADVDGIAAYLDARLSFMVRQRLDSQILVGDGIAPNLLGTINVGSINSQALGTDSREDCIYKGAKAARVTGRSQPNVVIIHPNDWEPIRLHTTTDGVYIWGSPSEAGPARIWGLPVIETTAVTEGTTLVGDYARFSGLHVRSGLEVMTGYVNDDFLDGRVTIRAGIRVAVVHYRPSAFTQCTGM